MMGLDSSGSEQRSVAESCEHCNETSGSVICFKYFILDFAVSNFAPTSAVISFSYQYSY
jgi:hypothetical protein